MSVSPSPETLDADLARRLARMEAVESIKALNPNMTVLALEGSFASVLGGAPAAAAVFSGEVNARTAADPVFVDSVVTRQTLLAPPRCPPPTVEARRERRTEETGNGLVTGFVRRGGGTIGAGEFAERNAGQAVVQPVRDGDLGGPAQGDARLLLGFDLGRAFGADGKVLRGTQIRVHPQFAVHIGGDSLARQMLGGTETR